MINGHWSGYGFGGRPDFRATRTSALLPKTDLRGTWRWTCCGGRHSGTFRISTQNPDGTFSGRFGDSADDARSPLSGRITSAGIEFTRTILSAGQNQLWKAQLSGTGSHLTMINGKWSGYGFAGQPDFRAVRSATNR
jgi:hypothetical protein